MTRARTASYGVGTPPPLDRWIDAVLMLFAILVQGVAATFGMIGRQKPRDWHTQRPSSALPQTKPDIHTEENLTTPTVSFSGLSRESLLETPKGLTVSPSETINRDSRDKPENDPVDVATLEAGKARVPTRTSPSPVIPAEARQRGLSRRSAAKAEELEPRSHTHMRQHVPPLASGSRPHPEPVEGRASGMTSRAQIRPI